MSINFDLRKLLFISCFLTLFAGDFSLDRINENFPEIKLLYLFSLINIIIFILTIITYKKIYYKGNLYNLFYFIFYIFIVVMLFSFFQSEDKMVSLFKFIDILIMFIVISIIFITFKLVKNSKILINPLAKLLIWIGMLYFLILVASFSIGNEGGGVGISGPNVATRIAFFSLVANVYIFFQSKKNMYLIFAFLQLLSIIMLGSRGGMLGAFITLAFLFVITLREKEYLRSFSIKHLIIIILTLPFLFPIFNLAIEVFNERFIKLFVENIYYSGRDAIYLNSFDLIKQNFILGNGLDGYAINFDGAYAHNIVVEVLLEAGVLALILLIVLLFFALFPITFQKNKYNSVFSVVPFYMIVVSMFSGSLFDFRYFFFFVLIVISVNYEHRKEKQTRAFTSSDTAANQN